MCHIFSLLFETKGYTEEADGTIVFGGLVAPGTVSCARSPERKAILLTEYSSLLLILLAVTLLECGVIWRNYYDFQIAFNLFFNLANYLLLVIVVWGVNTTLIGRLKSGQSAVKVITLVLSGFMGLLTAALIGLSGYIAWSRTPAGNATLESDTSLEKYIDVLLSYQRYALAYWVLYLLSVIAAGGLAIATLIRMRSRNILVGVGFHTISSLISMLTQSQDIFFWTAALFFSMLFWVIFQIIPFAAGVANASNIQPVTYIAIQYLNDFFLLFSYISLIFLSKSKSWEHAHASQAAYNNTGYDAPAFAPVAKPQEQQYAYNGGHQYVQPSHQNQYYHPQQAVHNGVAAPVNGNGHV